MLIMNLDKKWDHIASTLSTVTADDVGIGDITSQLMDEETHHGGPHDALDEQALYVKAYSKHGVRTCYKCGKTGHIARNCKENGEKETAKDNKNKQQVHQSNFAFSGHPFDVSY